MERASLGGDSGQKFFRRKYACMYSWVIKLCLKSNIKECYVVSGNTKDVVSMKFNQLCQGQSLSSGHTAVQGLLRVTAAVVWISQVKIHSYIFLTPSRVWVRLWNALGGWCQKYTLHSVTESRPGWKTHSTSHPDSWAHRACRQELKQSHPGGRQGLSLLAHRRKETFEGKTWHQSSHDFSGSHTHISAIIYHWAQRTESFYVEHFLSSICAPSYHSIQEPHSLSCICPHNIPMKQGSAVITTLQIGNWGTLREK